MSKTDNSDFLSTVPGSKKSRKNRTIDHNKNQRKTIEKNIEARKENMPDDYEYESTDIDVTEGHYDKSTGEVMLSDGSLTPDGDIDINKKFVQNLNKDDNTPMTYNERLSGFFNLMKSESVWGANQLFKKSIQAAMTMLSTKTGIYCKIPIYCKGEKCPYSESCGLVKWKIYPLGQACPVEIAFIERQWSRYRNEFDIQPEDATDEAIVAEIIRMEVYMERCTALMSKEGSPIQLMTVGVSEDGTPVETPSVSKSVEAYEKFSKIRNKNYELMLASRKDKLKNKEDSEDQKSIFDIIEEAEQDPDYYKIDQRPEYIEGVDDKEE